MLSATHRFHRRNDIQRLHRAGETARTQGCVLRYAPAVAQYRAAVVVSKKVSKSAVVRNRIRRRVYEQIRLTAQQRRIKHDLVFVIHDEAFSSISSTELASRIQGLLGRLPA